MKFSDITTFSSGGEIKNFIEVKTVNELISALTHCVNNNDKFLVVGGGSNILPPDDKYDGTVILDRTSDFLDDFVQKHPEMVNLSGIPGTLNGAIVQNAGAYGSEISEFIKSVDVLNLKTMQVETLVNSDCGFEYRNSTFKVNWLGNPGATAQYIVLSSTLKDEFKNEREYTNEEIDLRNEILQKRDEKGMLAPGFKINGVINEDSERYSTGSFFKNPIISKSKYDELIKSGKLPESAPAYLTQNQDEIKLSAAYLIELTGWKKGERRNLLTHVSKKHVLAIVNDFPSSTKRLGAISPSGAARNLSAEIICDIYKKFGIKLDPEVHWLS